MRQPFLHGYRDASRYVLRFERTLAAGRAFFAVAGLVAIYFDPTEPARFAALVYSLLALYAGYSITVLWRIHRASNISEHATVVLHGVDLAWASVLTFFSQGPVSPFFLFFLFVLLAAAYRWGSRETLMTAAVIVLVFLLETAVVAVGPWSATWFAGDGFAWNPIIMRITYLLITSFLLAFVAEREKQIRAEMAATADALRGPRAELGTDGSLGTVARTLSRMFDAATVDVVIRDLEDGRTTLYSCSTKPAGDEHGAAIQKLELDARHQAAWFFESPRTAWRVAQGHAEDTFDAVALTADWSAVRRVFVHLPPLFRDSRDFRSTMAVDFGLAGQWQGRAFLFDAPDAGDVAVRLMFFASLAEQVTPVLSNVLLLQRLQARAGAEARARVARDLHDGAIQALIGIDMETEALRRRAEREAPALLPELERIHDLLRREVVALRELMQELRPVDLAAAEHLPAVLTELVRRFQRDTGVDACLDCSGAVEAIPISAAIEFVRITQEALVNVRKHSGAGRVRVALSGEQGLWTLAVDDDGRGFDFEGRLSDTELALRRAGPAIIMERAHAIGGRVAVASTPGKGARVEVQVTAGSDV
jgi:signal transduction histidine kinase